MADVIYLIAGPESLAIFIQFVAFYPPYNNTVEIDQ